MTAHDRAVASTQDVLRWIAARDLPGRAARDAPQIDPAGTDQLIAAAEGERLLGPLLDAAISGDIELSERALERLDQRHAAAMAWCVLIEARLLEVRSWFDAAGGVEHRVIKGAAVAHLDEADPAMRSFADLDLLVAADDVDRAVRTLEGNGAVRPWPQRRPGFDRRFAKSVTLTCVDGIELDVHRTLCDGVHGVRIPLDRLFEQPDTFDLGGEEVPALTVPHRMLHAAYHAVLGSPAPRLMSLRDLAHYMTRAELSPDVVAPIARAWRGEAVLAMAIDIATDTLDVAGPACSAWTAWSSQVETPPGEAEIIVAQRREGSSFGRGKLGVLRELSGFGNKVAYGRAVAWPSADHLAARGLRRSDVLKALVGSGVRSRG